MKRSELVLGAPPDEQLLNLLLLLRCVVSDASINHVSWNKASHRFFAFMVDPNKLRGTQCCDVMMSPTTDPARNDIFIFVVSSSCGAPNSRPTPAKVLAKQRRRLAGSRLTDDTVHLRTNQKGIARWLRDGSLPWVTTTSS